jgi:flagellar biosynthetic protein FlhB
MADSSRTEKPTQRRLDRARREGNLPTSREFISSIHFVGFVALAAMFGGVWLMRTARLMRAMLAAAFVTNLTVEGVVSLARQFVAPSLIPILLCGAALMGLAISAQLATTRLGLSFAKLAPDFNRLNSLHRIASLPAQNLPMFLQALVLLPLVAAVVYFEATENLNSFLELPWMGPQPGAARVGGVIATLLWRASGLFLLVGVIDLVWQRRRYLSQLRMTKHEVRQEAKEQEGNPQMKARIRRIQRDMARRKMMQQVPKATAVIVNPTHYAVAIYYPILNLGLDSRVNPADNSGNDGSAPRVVAKGKNYLAGRIRQKAIEHQVPIVENPLLARALYTSVEVGQEIPGHLYRAVAEILAYIYRLMYARR